MRLLVPPPIVAVISAGLVALIARYVPEFGVTFPFQTYLAAILVAIGVAIDLSSIRLFYRQKTTISPLSPQKSSALVVEGIYRFTRNPMYLGMAIILSGFTVWMGNLAGLAIIPCFVWYITKFQIMPEEEALLEKFGVSYADYCNKVGRWI